MDALRAFFNYIQFVPDPLVYKACFEDPKVTKCHESASGPLYEFISIPMGESMWDFALMHDAVEKLDSHRDECEQCENRPLASYWFQKNESECRGCYCSCGEPLVSPYFVWNSWYRPLLHSCFQHLSRSRFLFLDSVEMQQDMPGAMNKIVQHAGLNLPGFDYHNVTEQMAHENFDRAYPDFKISSGWSHDLVTSSDSANMPMPEELRAVFLDFFQQDLDELRKLTGLALKKGWE